MVDITLLSSVQKRACPFGCDMLADVLVIVQELISILRQLANPGDDPSRVIGQFPRKVVLAGQSLGGDLQQLQRSPAFEFDILSKSVLFTTPPTTASHAVTFE
jgi:hypothetical protein